MKQLGVILTVHNI